MTQTMNKLPKLFTINLLTDWLSTNRYGLMQLDQTRKTKPNLMGMNVETSALFYFIRDPNIKRADPLLHHPLRSN